MGYHEVKNIGLEYPAGSIQLVTFYYRNIALPDVPENWIFIASNVEVYPNGQLVKPLYVGPLEAGQYVLKCINHCGGNGYAEPITIPVDPETTMPITTIPVTTLPVPTTAVPTTPVPVTTIPVTTLVPTTAVPTTAAPITTAGVTTTPVPTTQGPTTPVPVTTVPVTTVAPVTTLPATTIPVTTTPVPTTAPPPTQGPTTGPATTIPGINYCDFAGISGCIIWLDFTDTSAQNMQVSGGRIFQIADKSSQGNYFYNPNFQGNGPHLSTGYNGLPAGRVHDVNGYLQAINQTSNTDEYTIFKVGTIPAGRGLDNNGGWSIQAHNDLMYAVFTNPNTGQYLTAPGYLSPKNKAIVAFKVQNRLPASRLMIYDDGILVRDGGDITGWRTLRGSGYSWTLGVAGNLTQWGTGLIHEFIVFNRLLNELEMQSVFQCLNNKYGTPVDSTVPPATTVAPTTAPPPTQPPATTAPVPTTQGQCVNIVGASVTAGPGDP